MEPPVGGGGEKKAGGGERKRGANPDLFFFTKNINITEALWVFTRDHEGGSR